MNWVFKSHEAHNAGGIGSANTVGTTVAYDPAVTPLDDGKWHHVVAVQEGKDRYLYVDNRLILSPQTPRINGFIPGTVNLHTGAPGGRVESRFHLGSAHGSLSNQVLNDGTKLPETRLPDALIDRVRVYDNSLSATQVSALYHQDVDGDGLYDVTEIGSRQFNDVVEVGSHKDQVPIYLMNPARKDPPGADHDADGLTSLEEQNLHRADPSSNDTDNDGLLDGWEVQHRLSPTSAGDGMTDPDRDGLTNIEEQINGTDPHLADDPAQFPPILLTVEREVIYQFDRQSHGGQVPFALNPPLETNSGRLTTRSTLPGAQDTRENQRRPIDYSDLSAELRNRQPIPGTLTIGNFSRNGITALAESRTNSANNSLSEYARIKEQHIILKAPAPSPEERAMTVFIHEEKSGPNGQPTTSKVTPHTFLIPPGQTTSPTLKLTPRLFDHDGGPGFQLIQMRLLHVRIDKVISNQIPNNDCNSLPSPYYGGYTNNPMLMAARADGTASVRCEVSLRGRGNQATVPANLLLGVRQVSQRQQPMGNQTLAAVPILLFPQQTVIDFIPVAARDDKLPRYEVCGGYDKNGDGALQNNEVGVYFSKTPQTQKNPQTGKIEPYTGNLGRLRDLFRVASLDHASYAKDELLGNFRVMLSPGFAGDYLEYYLEGDITELTVEAEADRINKGARIRAQGDGLGHPVGVDWNANCSGTTIEVEFFDESEFSKAASRVALVDIATEYAQSLAPLLRALKPGLGNSVFKSFSLTGREYSFKKGSTYLSEATDLFFALGRVRLHGTIGFEVRHTIAQGKEVLDVYVREMKMQIVDTYDFAYTSELLPRQAAIVQSSFSSRLLSEHAGKVFKTKINIDRSFVEKPLKTRVQLSP